MNEQKLREIIAEDLGCEIEGVGSADKLFSTGIVDSFALISLVMHLENEARIRITPGQITLENFDTLQAILRLVNDAMAT